ncbi:hypothetical protein T459_03812 [Capsicum annuum]|uniref:Uncharacterized protein n=1 Tax=Capsicum annuum TaxID=4072 RepID=A0A2G3ANZ3_CAPAN|nr:hypothetical protein T459_03812 [Capsicum annuum]
MKIDTKMNIFPLKEDESWHLFVKNAGDVANMEYIQPLVKDIAREYGGLPLSITVIGTSMRGKTRVELCEDVMSINDDVEDKLADMVDNNISQPRRSKRITIPFKKFTDFVVGSSNKK